MFNQKDIERAVNLIYKGMLTLEEIKNVDFKLAVQNAIGSVA